jgi:hypothetical protein
MTDIAPADESDRLLINVVNCTKVHYPRHDGSWTGHSCYFANERNSLQAFENLLSAQQSTQKSEELGGSSIFGTKVAASASQRRKPANRDDDANYYQH